MATNLRLSPETERALRAESTRTGRSQQDLIREAIDRYLGLRDPPAPSEMADLLRAGTRPPRGPYRRVTTWLEPPAGGTAALLDREDRL